MDLPRAVGASFADAISLRLLRGSTSPFWEWVGYFRAYVTEFGQARIPVDYVTSDGLKLGSWASDLRKDRKNGTLPKEREAVLERLGFVWDVLEDDFEKGLTSLKGYVEKNGDARVSSKYRTEGGFPLGHWINHKRKAHRAGTLSRARTGGVRGPRTGMESQGRGF